MWAQKLMANQVKKKKKKRIGWSAFHWLDFLFFFYNWLFFFFWPELTIWMMVWCWVLKAKESILPPILEAMLASSRVCVSLQSSLSFPSYKDSCHIHVIKDCHILAISLPYFLCSQLMSFSLKIMSMMKLHVNWTKQVVWYSSLIVWWILLCHLLSSYHMQLCILIRAGD